MPNETKGLIPKKITKARLERAKRVQDLLFRSWPIKRIAEELGISESQAYKDKRVAIELARRGVQEWDQDAIIGQTIERLQHDIARFTALAEEVQESGREGEEGESLADSNRVGYYKLALRAHEQLVKFYLDTGLVTKVPDRVVMSTEIPEQAFHDPEIRRLYLKIMALVRQHTLAGGPRQLPGPGGGGDVVDADWEER